MFQKQSMRTVLVQILALIALWPEQNDCLIITSVLAGDKKFKTISFDHKFLKPIKFEKEMPLTEFRRHRTLRPPKFDIDINIPIKLPLEDEYPQEEYKKPVVSDIFFQTSEINEPSYGRKSKGYPNAKPAYSNDLAYAASDNKPIEQALHRSAGSQSRSNARSDVRDSQQMVAQESTQPRYASKGNQQQYKENYDYPPFIPGGFVNLQLSGPTGGPKMTYEDYDREKWAQKLSQTPGAMPYPILNYHQLQNYYGGLGTFTNGLADNRYEPENILEKAKDHFEAGLSQLVSKLQIGRG